MKEGVRMNEQINRKKSYGLMIIAMLLYGVDLAAVYYCTQLLYKNIVEITVIVVLVPIYFIIWALRGKEGKAQELKSWVGNKKTLPVTAVIAFVLGLVCWALFPYMLEGGYLMMMGLGQGFYHWKLKNKIPGWGQRISEPIFCILILVFLFIFTFPRVTGLKTVNQAEVLLRKQGLDEVQYAVNTYPRALELIYEKAAPELTMQEEKTDLYVFSALDNGKEIGVIVSPASGRIVAETPLSENLVLELMIHQP